jgi:hypothetical protein
MFYLIMWLIGSLVLLVARKVNINTGILNGDNLKVARRDSNIITGGFWIIFTIMLAYGWIWVG